MSEAVGNRQRLAAILAADAAGYSRLMSQDDVATVASLDAARAVFRSEVERHEGRVIDMAGDSVLAVFTAATGAVEAALAVQKCLEERNVGVPADRRLRFRIGVHLGDVIEKADGTVYGDGVNIAARLEGLALPGGVTVSDAVQSAVRHRIAAAFQDLGEQEVKNIADPVRVFRVVNRAEGSSSTAATVAPIGLRWPSRRVSLWEVAIVGIAALVALSFFVWQRLGQSTGSDAPALSLAVLPFDAAVPEEKAVAEAMGREVATGLARGPPLQVASYNASATYRGAGQSSTAIAGALGVRYTLEAELRRENRMLTVDFRLLEGHSGATVATRRIETRDDQPATQQLAALRATAAVSRTLVRHERLRIVNRPPRNPSAMELALQADGMLMSNDGNADLPAKVIQLYDEAIRRDPGLAYPLYRKADVLSNVTQFPGPDRTQGVLELDRITLHAIRLAPQDARAWDTRAEALRQQQRWDAALEASATALRLDPSNPSLMHQRAFALMWVGRSAEALPFSIRAIEIASEDDDIAEYRRLLCRAHLVLGRYDDAINECERAASHANFWPIHEFLTAAYALKGDMERARAAKERLLRARPRFTISWIEGYVALQHPTWQDQFKTHVIAGLRKAGVPER